MSDSEAETSNNTTDNDASSNNVPESEERWKSMAAAASTKHGGAVDEAVQEDGTDDVDLDHLNDNLHDGFEDNLSLEVNFGDGSSCRASDVSSLSFQNIALEDGDNPDGDPNMDIVFRHQGSISESSDSPLNDFQCDDDDDDDDVVDGIDGIRFSGHLSDELKCKETLGHTSRLLFESPDEFDYESDSTNTGTMKRRNKLSFCTSAACDTPITNLSAPSSHLSCPSTHQPCGDGTDNCSSPSTNCVQQPVNKSRYLAAFQDQLAEGKCSGNMTSAHVQPSGTENKDTSPKDSAETPSDAGDTTPTASETLHSNSSNGNQSDTSMDVMPADGVSGTSGVQKRNSLEIRNNIPNTKEVKKYVNDQCDDRLKLQGKGAVPKIRKKSPGLARRLADSVQIQSHDHDSSSSERESEPAQIDTTVHSAQKDFELKLQKSKASSGDQEHQASSGETGSKLLTNGKSDSFEKLCDSLLGNDSQNYTPSSGDCNTSPEDGEQYEGQVKGMEIENEYDYIKYARIQHGDSYVGMRLAYSSSSDSLSAKRNNWSGSMRTSDEDFLGSSYEGSPEKLTLHQPRISGQIHVSKVNEDTLTEIPLNGSDHLGLDDKNFSLSPETTECDSAEVESVISEEGKSSTSGMPIVEDGLSSSQGSDAEDISMHDIQEQTPSEILKRRYKAEIDQELQANDGPTPENFNDEISGADNSVSAQSTPSHASGTSCTSTLENQRNKEVDLAIKDIKSAIERSKQAARQREAQASDDGTNQEPVWVMRDSYVKKLGHHNDLQQVRDEYQRHQEEECNKNKEGEDYQGDGDEDDVSYPYHNDTKTFPSNKGFRSDDEITKHDQVFYERSRHLKGRQYKAVPAEEPTTTGHNTMDMYKASNCGQFRDTSVQQSNFHLSNNSTKTNSLNSDNVQKLTPSFSATLTNSRYQPTSASQYSVSSTSQSNTYQKQSSSQSILPSNPTGGCQLSQQTSGSTLRQSPSLMLRSSGQILSSDLSKEGRTHGAESPERIASGEPLSPCDHSRHRRRRYPSYEYHDESEDDCYDDEDGNMTAYIHSREHGDYDTDEETDELLDKQYTRSEKVDIPELSRPPVNRSAQVEKRRTRVREVTLRDPENETVLIEGVLFRARYLGSTQLLSDGQPSKALRMMQAQEAVGRIKAPEGENQPSTEVDLFVSIEKIMVLNTDLQEIMMDHALRTISYIADIGDILVIMARRGPVLAPPGEGGLSKRKNKICCHVFETDEAQLIAQSIGQAFQVAYVEFLKANGIENPGILKEIDYQDVLNQQEIFGEELFLFSNKEMQKEVIVPKLKNEPLGVVIVESGWGSMVPTVVLANMSPNGAAARCGQLNIGDQIMSINGVSLVGIPLSSCQTYIKACRNQTAVKLNVVSCAPVVEVCIKRPDVKYQLGFSVQNGVICSLLRGGIAERGGVRVGHRIIEINGESVVAVPHEKIVKMLATSIGEIHMKTMPTSIFRLLTGQDTPHYI